MSNWGISATAPEKEKIKAEYADYLHGLNSCGRILYDIYSEMFDIRMELLDRMYKLGMEDATQNHENNYPKCGAEMDEEIENETD